MYSQHFYRSVVLLMYFRGLHTQRKELLVQKKSNIRVNVTIVKSAEWILIFSGSVYHNWLRTSQESITFSTKNVRIVYNAVNLFSI